jgi:hypothetical protein
MAGDSTAAPAVQDQSFGAAVACLQTAVARVALGDVSLIKALHSHADDATAFYGWGGYEQGWEAVSRRWDWAGTRFGGGTVSYQNLASGVGGGPRLYGRYRDLPSARDGRRQADAALQPRHPRLPP